MKHQSVVLSRNEDATIYVVESTRNTLYPEVGSVLNEKEVRSLMMIKGLNVAIRHKPRHRFTVGGGR